MTHGDVRCAPAGNTRGVGIGADGLLRAGRLHVEGTVTAGGVTLPVTSVNATRPAAQGIAVRTAFGSAQPRLAAWYVTVRDGRVVSSSDRDPGAPRREDVLLSAGQSDRRVLATVGPAPRSR